MVKLELEENIFCFIWTKHPPRRDDWNLENSLRACLASLPNYGWGFYIPGWAPNHLAAATLSEQKPWEPEAHDALPRLESPDDAEKASQSCQPALNDDPGNH